MIDYFALALTHGLIFLALIRLAGRQDLDEDPAAEEFAPRSKRLEAKADNHASNHISQQTGTQADRDA